MWSGSPIGGIQVGELVIGEECTEDIAHQHIDVAFAEAAAHDFSCRFGNTGDGLRLQGHTSPTFYLKK